MKKDFRSPEHYKFPRTLQEAFKDADYASPIEHPPRWSGGYLGFVLGCAIFVIVVSLII